MTDEERLADLAANRRSVSTSFSDAYMPSMLAERCDALGCGDADADDVSCQNKPEDAGLLELECSDRELASFPTGSADTGTRSCLVRSTRARCCRPARSMICKRKNNQAPCVYRASPGTTRSKHPVLVHSKNKHSVMLFSHASRGEPRQKRFLSIASLANDGALV